MEKKQLVLIEYYQHNTRNLPITDNYVTPPVNIVVASSYFIFLLNFFWSLLNPQFNQSYRATLDGPLIFNGKKFAFH